MLSQQIKAFYIRIDTVEQGLRDLCNYKVEGEGYRLSYRLARDNLQLPTWHQVQNREYDKWDETVIRIDTFNKKPLESLKELVEKLAKNDAYSQ